MRKTVLLLGIAATLAFTGCVDQTETPDDGELNESLTDDNESSTDDDTNTSNGVNGTEPAGEDEGAEDDSDVIQRVDGDGYVEFAGSGTATTDTVAVDEGLVRFDVENLDVGEDTGIFNVRLLDAGGEVVENVVTSSGNWSGREMRHLDRGSYSIEVESTGNWSVRLSTDLPAETSVPDFEHSGAHSGVFGPFEHEKTVEVGLQVDDEEHAVVDLYGPEGRFDSMLNQVGPAEDVALYSTDRVHWIFVDTDSEDWSVTVRTVE